jgi:hypothetical protein
MPPIAVCSAPRCDFRVELQKYKEGTSVPTPSNCPACGEAVISVCPQCGFLLLGISGRLVCEVCRTDIRAAFARLRITPPQFIHVVDRPV